MHTHLSTTKTTVVSSSAWNQNTISDRQNDGNSAVFLTEWLSMINDRLVALLKLERFQSVNRFASGRLTISIRISRVM